jgi:hypothetical protein
MNKLRIIFSCLILTTFSVTVDAQDFILWEISGNGLQAPSYLFGTLKFIGEKEYYIPSQVTSRIDKSKIFAIEDQVDDHARHELNTAFHFPPGESLATQLSKDDYQKVENFFGKEFNIGKSTFESKYAKLKPLPLSMVMTRLSLGEKVKYYDVQLLFYAKHHNLDCYSLEEVGREAAALKAFPMEDQVAALLHSVNNFDQQKSEYRKLMTDFSTGNIEEIYQYTLHPTENNPAFVESFYYKRNEEWLPKIEKMMADKPSFVVVGISHLEGERGLISLLKKKGYTLTGVATTK